MNVSLFHCSPYQLQNTPGLFTWLRTSCKTVYAEMSCLQPLTSDLSQTTWEWEFEKHQGKDIDWCFNNNVRIIGRMDDGFRTPPEREAFKRSRGKVEYAAWRFSNRGICDWVEVCDEMGQDPSVYPTTELAEWWYGSGGPDLAFPGVATQRFEKLTYQGQLIARRISRQWNHSAATTQQQRLDWLRGSLSGLPGDARYVVGMVPISARYRKLVPGTSKQPGDKWINKPATNEQIEEMIDLARLCGADHCRLYANDAWWFQDRAKAALGDIVQWGMGPMDERWPGFLQVLGRVTK